MILPAIGGFDRHNIGRQGVSQKSHEAGSGNVFADIGAPSLVSDARADLMLREHCPASTMATARAALRRKSSRI